MFFSYLCKLENKKEKHIRALKYILRIIVGFVAGLYLALLLLTSLPAFQSWGAGVASRMLAGKIGSSVSVGSLRVSLLGRVILDNVQLYDRRDTLMLQSSRIAAKVDLMPLLEKRIRVSGAQLIGTRVRLYKDGDEPCNFQFLVDAFSSEDSTKSPLDLGINALVLRRGELRFDRLDMPATPGKLNPSHLHFTDMSLTARILAQLPDTLAIDLRNLSLCEQSGLCLQKASFQTGAGKHSANVTGLRLELPESTIEAQCSVDGAAFLDAEQSPIRIDSLLADGSIEARICPRDLRCLMPRLATFADAVSITSDVRLENGSLRLTDLSVGTDGENISLLSDVTIQDFKDNPTLHANIAELRTGPQLQQFLTENLLGHADEISPVLTRLGGTKTSGTVTYRRDIITSKLLTESEQGTLSVDATLHNMKELNAEVKASDLKVGHLLGLTGNEKNTTATFELAAGGDIPTSGHPARLSATGTVKSLTYRDYEHRNMQFAASINGNDYAGEFVKEESNGLIQVDLQTAMQQDKRTLKCNARVKDFAPNAMNLTREYAGERFSGNMEAEFSDTDPNHLEGWLKLTDLTLSSEQKQTLHIGDIDLSSECEEKAQHIRLQSDFLSIRTDGNMNWKSLAGSFIHPVRQNLPSLFAGGNSRLQPSGNDFHFIVQAKDTVLAKRILGVGISLPETCLLEGTISDAVGQIALQLHAPRLQFAGQQLQDIDCRMESNNASIQASMQFNRILKDKPVEVNLDAYGKDDKVTSRLRWDNKRNPSYSGDVSMTGNIRHDLASRTAIEAKLKASQIIVGDTAWLIRPASISYHDGIVDVKDFSISQAEKHITAGGRISSLATDTLKAELVDIDISYIMDLVNFHDVDFDGDVTGSIYGTSLMKNPFADAYLQVKNFTFNEAEMGNMDLYANWGKQERSILLEADMKGPYPLHRTQVHGTIIPGKGKDDGLNLNINTSHIDLSFISKYTQGVLSNLQGRASGRARVFGPFDTVNMEGDMIVDELKTHIVALGTDYHLAGDSVIMRPDNIWLRGATVYDNVGIAGMNEHAAKLDMHLIHNAFKDLTYSFDVNASNILCYNTTANSGSSFYGTVYADAEMHMKGELGKLDVDVTATPMPGTTIIYNVSTPGAVDETEFVTYVSQRDTAQRHSADINAEQEKTSADVRINFNIDATQNAQIQLIMDPRTGDNITLGGEGRLLANFYNKGRFQLYGTYRISEGTYRMSIRDLIRKDFTFVPDGTIIFGGDAMQAALNLKAKHTVHNVSLDDLSTTGLGLSNTRVDCIMNIGGIAREPVVTFDFDIPAANEDEKQMVRSMLSSEEERDIQAIYLLGVGRFYSYGTLMDKNQTQGGMAMNSMLSSVLSSRFNQIMSQALGGSNWSFGTNLHTGQTGWEQLDVEGMLSGRMLSGRLLFNGNFGYRDNKYNARQSNFIGDFDILYRLSPRSPFSLKAYSQTNDRYFTQSSLTTQGIGIQFQRDFNHWKELFMKTKQANKKKQK